MADDEAVTAQTMDRLVRVRAARHAAAPMVIDPRHTLNYGELDTTTRDLAATLIDAGVGKGTRVGLLMPNGTEWVRIAVALTRIGGILVPLSTLLRPPELRAQLRVASVQFLVSVEEFRGRRYLDDLDLTADDDLLLDPQLPALRHVRTPGQLTAACAAPAPPSFRQEEHAGSMRTDDQALPAENRDERRFDAGPRAASMVDALAATVTAADPLAVMFTSGSRGLPKAVVHSHGSAFGAVRSGLASRCIDRDTRLYLPMPFFWVGGFGGGVLSALLAGAALITEDIPRPETTLNLLRRERVTLFRGWPDQAESLARQAETRGVTVPTLRPGSLEALLPAHLRAQPGARANLFGMTESFGPYCGYPADTDMPRSAWGSCGTPFPGMEVRITDPDDGRPVPTGTVGIIQIRGPHTLRGMCGRGREDVFTADGYYSTGDLGRLDDDGFLFYHGRSDDMFKVSGATVYPGEVERALRGIEGVSSAFVTNVPGPQGERVAAAVVCDTATASADRLHAAARELLSSFKVPAVWLLLDSDDDVPRGPTGKVDISRLRQRLSVREPANGTRAPVVISK
ncbi:class I adenylate-forming enzyme family protein [Nocardia wallacei]|uniref:class I adenylate-forming enzyme family protein n=1 Tax=Nocardia wallacei TaxID=480035 RepID=UPI002455EDBE|nr:long-chain fatty acid--CoA ligase [Nocardia wallacei]